VVIRESSLICSQADVTSLGCAQACSGVLRLCLGMLTLGSGKSGSCSLLETKTEIARGKSNTEFRGISKEKGHASNFHADRR
jgi:hypothetical protein